MSSPHVTRTIWIWVSQLWACCDAVTQRNYISAACIQRILWNKHTVCFVSLRLYWIPWRIHGMYSLDTFTSWWGHQKETFSALLAICAGNPPVTGEFPTQRPVTRSFDVFIDLRLNKRLSKQSCGWWYETPPLPLWRLSNDGLLHWHLGNHSCKVASEVTLKDMGKIK